MEGSGVACPLIFSREATLNRAGKLFESRPRALPKQYYAGSAKLPIGVAILIGRADGLSPYTVELVNSIDHEGCLHPMVTANPSQ
jgi:hypothetical protein